MEKAILRTLNYANLLDYPLKSWEIHKWLISKKASLTQIDKALKKLIKDKKIKTNRGYFYLKGRDSLVKKRILAIKISKKYLFKAKLITWSLKVIPSIKLIGVTGALSLENAKKKDEINLFIISEKNEHWLFKLFLEKFKKKIGGRVCIKTILNEEDLAYKNKDIHLAYEVLQMKVLWEKDGIYSKYLLANEWVFKFLPNWITPFSRS